MADWTTWKLANLSSLATACALLSFGIAGEHFAECSSTPMWGRLCSLSGNAFMLNDLGYETVKAAGTNEDHIYLIDLVRVCTVVQFVGAGLAWGLYMFSNKMSAAFVTTMTHFAGWVLLVAAVTEVPHFNALIDPAITGSQTTTEFSFGSAVVVSIVATVLQLLTVVSIIAEYMYNRV